MVSSILRAAIGEKSPYPFLLITVWLLGKLPASWPALPAVMPDQGALGACDYALFAYQITREQITELEALTRSIAVQTRRRALRLCTIAAHGLHKKVA